MNQKALLVAVQLALLIDCTGSEEQPVFDVHAMSRAAGMAETLKIADSEDLLRTILSHNPRWGEGWLYLGRSLAAQKKFAEGALAIQKGGELGERRSTVWLEACSMAHQSGDDSVALIYLKKALDQGVHRKWLIQPTSFDGYLNLGNLLNEEGAYQLLMAASKVNSSLHPDLIKTERMLWRFNNNELDLAPHQVDSLYKSWLQTSRSLPQQGELLYSQGRYWLKVSDFEKARESFELARQDRFIPSACNGWLAYIHAQLGNKDSAFALLQNNLECFDTPNWIFDPDQFEPLHGDERWNTLITRFLPSNAPAIELREKGRIVYPTKDWKMAEPTDVGLRESTLADAVEGIKKGLPNVTSLLIVRDGKLAFEHYFHGYDKNDQFNIKSVTKSVTALLTGIAWDKGLLPDLNTPIHKILPHYFTDITDSLKYSITIEHLLTMTMGTKYLENNDESLALYASGNSAYLGLRLKQVNVPGTVYNYSSISTEILGIILAEVTGMDLLNFARENLFDPLGIKPEFWAQDLQGYYIGAAELRLLPRDMAKLGLLVLNGGIWNGKQIVSREWIERATAIHVPQARGPHMSYGYQFRIANVRGHRTILCQGYGGQRIAVVPSLDMVCVVTSEPVTPDNDPDLILGEWVVPAAVD